MWEILGTDSSCKWLAVWVYSCRTIQTARVRSDAPTPNPETSATALTTWHVVPHENLAFELELIQTSVVGRYRKSSRPPPVHSEDAPHCPPATELHIPHHSRRDIHRPKPLSILLRTTTMTITRPVAAAVDCTA